MSYNTSNIQKNAIQYSTRQATFHTSYWTNNQLINIVSEIVGKDVKFEYVKDSLGHDRKYALNISKYNEKFGNLTYIDLKEWLSKIIG